MYPPSSIIAVTRGVLLCVTLPAAPPAVCVYTSKSDRRTYYWLMRNMDRSQARNLPVFASRRLRSTPPCSRAQEKLYRQSNRLYSMYIIHLWTVYTMEAEIHGMLFPLESLRPPPPLPPISYSWKGGHHRGCDVITSLIITSLAV